LFNLQGQVVGINSQIYSNTGNYMGVSFSIPIDVAMSAIQQLKTKGYVSRGVLGVEVQPVTDDMAKAFKLSNATGAAVVSVTAGSAAERAGIQAGDIILSYDGKPLMQASDLPPLVGMTKPGTKVPLQILRGGAKQNIEVAITELPRDDQAVDGSAQAGASPQSSANALGLTVQALDAATRKQMGLGPGLGVAISNITGEAAAQAGLQPGDVILLVNQQKITGVAAFRDALRGIGPGNTVLLLVRRGTQNSFLALTVPPGH